VKDRWTLTSFIMKEVVVEDVGKLIQGNLYAIWMSESPLCIKIVRDQALTNFKTLSEQRMKNDVNDS